MQTHNISRLRLVNLHVNATGDVLIHNYENVKAIMNVSYGEKDDDKILYYHISVEEDNRRIYSMKCEFHYNCDEVYDEKEMILMAVQLISPHVEEMISLMTLLVNPRTN